MESIRIFALVVAMVTVSTATNTTDHGMCLGPDADLFDVIATLPSDFWVAATTKTFWKIESWTTYDAVRETAQYLNQRTTACLKAQFGPIYPAPGVSLLCWIILLGVVAIMAAFSISWCLHMIRDALWVLDWIVRTVLILVVFAAAFAVVVGAILIALLNIDYLGK